MNKLVPASPAHPAQIWIASYTASENAGTLSRGLLFRSIHDSKEEAEAMGEGPNQLNFTVVEYVRRETGKFWPCKDGNHEDCAVRKWVECVCRCHRIEDSNE